jgi:hypothetical protein
MVKSLELTSGLFRLTSSYVARYDGYDWAFFLLIFFNSPRRTILVHINDRCD